MVRLQQSEVLCSMSLLFFLFRAITTVELLICIKFGTELFAKTDLVKVALWLLFQVNLVSGHSCSLYLVRLGLVSTFLDVGFVKISCELMSTRFFYLYYEIQLWLKNTQFHLPLSKE